MSAREMIQQFVLNQQGCKATVIASQIHLIQAAKAEDTDLVTLIFDMVKSGDLVGIEYALPNMQYRIKTMLFPKGTQFTSDTLAKFFDTI